MTTLCIMTKYFQVENYSQELSKTLDHTNFPIAVSHRKSAVIQREITPPPRPITPTPPDISDERLEHMRKLQKIKNFISGDQADYYKRVITFSFFFVLFSSFLSGVSREKYFSALVKYLFSAYG